MGRFSESAEDEQETGIDMSPLIDCVFILLIFFIVTTVFVEETGIEVDKPEAASSANLEKNSILLAVSANGDVVYGGRNIGLNGVRSQVQRLLAADSDPMPVIVQVDRDAPSGLFVRVIDEAKLGGAEKVSVSTLTPR